jgi:hypothetical protein
LKHATAGADIKVEALADAVYVRKAIIEAGRVISASGAAFLGGDKSSPAGARNRR